jgi:hypothetical protein
MKAFVLLCPVLGLVSFSLRAGKDSDMRPPEFPQTPAHTPVLPGFPSGVSGSRAVPLSVAYDNALVSLRKRAEKLHTTAGAEEPEMQALLATIQTNAAFLGTRWREWASANPAALVGSPGTDPYLRSLERDYDLLRKAEPELARLRKTRSAARGSRGESRMLYALATTASRPTGPGDGWSRPWAATTNRDASRAKALDLLQTVDLDLQVKADHCRQSASGLGRTVQVSVRTRHDGAETPGYEVWFVQKGYYGTKSAYDRFRKQSSPTEERGLAPGGYAFWVQKARQGSEPTTIRLGGHGENRAEVDLEAP